MLDQEKHGWPGPVFHSSRHPGERRGPEAFKKPGFRPFDKAHGPEYAEGLSPE
jgi:hypothetical protein